MKASEIKDLSPDELKSKLSDLDKERFNLRFQLAMGEIENPMRIRDVKRDIARIKTVLKEKELGD
ncbi:MAG: 50S ribosomal protein L29 [Nitrospirota bacterium]